MHADINDPPTLVKMCATLAAEELDQECARIHGEDKMHGWRSVIPYSILYDLVAWKKSGRCCIVGALARIYSEKQVNDTYLYAKAMTRQYLSGSRVRHVHDWRGLLSRAVKLSDCEFVKCLLAEGLDVNSIAPSSYPVPVVWEARRIDIRDLLISQGADLNSYRGTSGLCGYYLTYKNLVGGEHVDSLLPHVRAGRLHVFPCERELLQIDPHGPAVLLAHEACCRDLLARVESASPLPRDLCVIVLDYVIPADPHRNLSSTRSNAA